MPAELQVAFRSDALRFAGRPRREPEADSFISPDVFAALPVLLRMICRRPPLLLTLQRNARYSPHLSAGLQH